VQREDSEGATMFQEFKEFIMRGNVVDLAVGVIIGGAFGKIIASLVEDVLLPPIGLALGNVDFSNLFINLSGKDFPSVGAAKAAGAATLNYGIFINHVLNFLIVAFAIFLLIKQINRMHRQAPAPAPAPTTKDCPYCLSAVPLAATKCAYCTAELK
jgi:large conductance mechanosensitive channel